MYELRHRLKRFIEFKPDPHKLVNYLLNKVSSCLLVSNYGLGMPHCFLLEVTNFCNLSCTLCPTGNGLLSRNKTRMIFNDFKKIMDKMADYLIEIGIGGFGEPFLNEDIYRMLEYIKSKGIFIEIFTNLLVLDKENIKK